MCAVWLDLAPATIAGGRLTLYQIHLFTERLSPATNTTASRLHITFVVAPSALSTVTPPQNYVETSSTKMNRRGGETPMDFAWDNKLGPVDPNSPFISYANQQTARKRM